ncbi:MAG: hypothetical protein JWR03_1204 [Cohnella sp.]|nr:hypothetical protein [Cohnella sp.]
MLVQSNKAISEDTMEWMQQPVCVVLNDGSYYVGWITGLNKKELTLSGRKGQGKIKKNSLHHSGKPRISAFVPEGPAFNSFEGGGFPPFGFFPEGAGFPGAGLPTAGLPAAGLPAGGGDGFMGFVKKAWPGIQIGMGIVRTIMPLMGGLKL